MKDSFSKRFLSAITNKQQELIPVCSPFTIGTSVINKSLNKAGKIIKIHANKYGMVEKVDIDSIEKNENGVSLFSSYNVPFTKLINDYVW